MNNDLAPLQLAIQTMGLAMNQMVQYAQMLDDLLKQKKGWEESNANLAKRVTELVEANENLKAEITELNDEVDRLAPASHPYDSSKVRP